jgi:tryptophanyl-tRNA synthetase
MNLVTVSRLQRNPTIKTEIKQRGFEKSVPMGFLNYPVSQAADITAFKANLIPVGDDQEPMIEQTREIVRSFNRVYNTNTLVECKSFLPGNDVCMRLPGTDGDAKMSKSLGNCIYLSDEDDVIRKKVNSIASMPRALEDPGIIEGNIAFIYLNAFCTDDHFKKYYPEYNNLSELEAAYKKGGIGDGTIKKFLCNVMIDVISPIRERRKEYSKRIDYILDVLASGTKKANDIANKTLMEVKEAMGIDYCSETFKKEQINKYN